MRGGSGTSASSADVRWRAGRSELSETLSAAVHVKLRFERWTSMRAWRNGHVVAHLVHNLVAQGNHDTLCSSARYKT